MSAADLIHDYVNGLCPPPAPPDAPSLIAGAREYIQTWQELEKLEAQVKELKSRLDFLEPIIAESMSAERLDNVSLDGRTLYRKETTRYSVVKDPAKRKEAIEVARANGWDELVTFNWTAISSRMREFAEANEGALPPALAPYIEKNVILSLGNTKSSRA